MIIIFGTRPTFRTEKVNQYDFCSQCNQFGKLRSYNATKFFHLYYIPLIPLKVVSGPIKSARDAIRG